MQPIKFDQVVFRDEKVEAFCKCSICLEVFQDPMCCENCENHFCILCITTWSQSQPARSCPLCHDLKEKPAQRILKNLLSSLQIYCGNRNLGCQQILQYDDYQRHMSSECHQRWTSCEICHQVILFSSLKQHLDECPERIVECDECQEPIKLKSRTQHLDEVCQNVKIDCSGCSENLPRHAIPIHQNQCPEFVIECINCDSSMKRKDLVHHSLQNCVQVLKHEQNKHILDLNNQLEELRLEMTNIKSALKYVLRQHQSYKQFKPLSLIKFSSQHKHPEIYLFQQNTFAQIQDVNSILKDRFVYIDLDKELNGGVMEVTFFFPNITDRFVAFGIADISNLSQKKDYYKLNHLAYLFSANGVIYSSHSAEENGRKKEFRFDSGQKLNLVYDPVNCKVTAQNLNTGQQYTIDIPFQLIQMYGKSFYPVVCLRGAGDQVHILN